MPKTQHSRRTVTLTEHCVSTLRRHKSAQAERRLRAGAAWQDGDLVFADLDGAPVPPYRVSRRFRETARAAGFEGLRFHDMRHTAATLMLRGGVHPKPAAARLGHANADITMRTYSHVQPDMDEHVAAVLDALLEPHVQQSG